MSSSEYDPKLIIVAFPGAMWTGHLFTQWQKQSNDATQGWASEFNWGFFQEHRWGAAGRSVGNHTTQVSLSLPTAPVHCSQSLTGIGEPLPQQLLPAWMSSEGVRASWAPSPYNINGLNLWNSLTGNYSCWAFKRATAGLSPCRHSMQVSCRITSL